jgi:hypothetical protein
MPSDSLLERDGFELGPSRKEILERSKQDYLDEWIPLTGELSPNFGDGLKDQAAAWA